ncbi:hypothetical protein QBZ16_000692 [Prototheca wickerhamii]|uniref:DNA polymerase epsilon catalytic subunit n=1 Tax=Prototheca wickerhamii TaxID=3111 RepID=A0AAD9MN72_PROWI|nr:hypothetical protein QBZ16_000692 [Prototheca wickerhamii]
MPLSPRQVSELLLQDRMGFPEYSMGPSRLGWLVNLNTVQTKPGHETEMDGWLRKRFEGLIADTEIVQREDLDLVRRELLPIVYRNKNRKAPSLEMDAEGGGGRDRPRAQAVQEYLVDIREHDVPHHMRFCIDTDVRCGCWYTVRSQHGKMSLEPRSDLVQRAEARVCAFDIETTKMPLQFPNAEFDQARVFMISYMVDRKGYLITNREVVSEDIQDFEYTPKPEFEGPFTIFNCENEAACLRRWFEHMREVQPSIFVTYNGDFFDWPFIETRAAKNGMDMAKEIGFRCNRNTNETLSRSAVHLDCMHWVNRDSYLPQGSRGLKVSVLGRNDGWGVDGAILC